jgi:hypothetical protein
MPRPLVAVIGDANKSRTPDLAKKAAEDLGAELARRGCRILVFSNEASFIESDFVRGYLATDVKKEPKSIQVRYPPQLHKLFPGETDHDELFDRQPQGSEWEVSFYPWLAAADGIVLIGGGYTTKVAGLIAIGAKTPMVALAGLGGAAEKVLEYLRQERRAIATDDDLNLMAQQGWAPTSAARCVDALLNQEARQKIIESHAELLKSDRKLKHGLTFLALAGSALFIAVLLAIAEALHSPDTPRSFLWLLFGAPGAAGASGAAIRVLWEQYSRDDGLAAKLRPVGMTITLGFWASGVAGALFLLPQIVSLGQLKPVEAYRLLPFSALVGLLAGLTLDKVFPRLIKIDVPLETDSLKAKEAQAGSTKDGGA